MSEQNKGYETETILRSDLLRLQRQGLEWEHKFHEAAAEIRQLVRQLNVVTLRMEKAEAFVDEYNHAAASEVKSK